MIEAYLNDPDVIDAMAQQSSSLGNRKAEKPSFFGWTAQLSALKDIQDQMIASRGGKQFVPRPVIPGFKEGQRRRDEKLSKTIDRICGSD